MFVKTYDLDLSIFNLKPQENQILTKFSIRQLTSTTKKICHYFLFKLPRPHMTILLLQIHSKPQSAKHLDSKRPPPHGSKRIQLKNTKF